MSYGWLPYRSDIVRDDSWFGIPLRTKNMPTRWEEYTFVKHELRIWEELPGTLLDVACGFEPGVHIFPEIAAKDGWVVEALDKKPAQVGFLESNRILRVEGNMLDMTYDAGIFDASVCISTLEHVEDHNKLKAFLELWRVLKPGGLLVVTMDKEDPAHFVDVLGKALFDFGDYVPCDGPSLNPAVSYLVGTKR